MGGGMLGQGNKDGYKAFDLIHYNGTKNAGLILQVHEDSVKVINEQGKIEHVKVVDAGKKQSAPTRRGGTLSGRDAKGNALVHDSMVKCINGPNKNIIAPIRHSFKNYLFLWSKDFVQSNGIFVMNCVDVVLLGDEFMKGSSSGQAIASQNRMTKDPKVGKQVVIIGGHYKGHRGRVTHADDSQCIVELSSQCRKIPIQYHWVSPIDTTDNK